MTETPTAETASRRDRIRDVIAAVLLILGLLLPWNVYFGLGITATSGWIFAVLTAVTVLSLAPVAASAADRRGIAGAAALTKLRPAASLPYLIVVAGFVLFTIGTSIHNGGTGIIAPGVGPGAWLGLAGALLAAQSPTGGDRQRVALACRVIGWLSIVLAAAAALVNLYLRTRFVVSGIGGAAGAANLTTATAGVLYSVVAVLPVLIAGRWIISGHPAARLATLLLAVSASVAATVLWILPVGRDLDSFHGITQNTGTAGVGYEGYLAWVAAAALTGTVTLRTALATNASQLWQAATRRCLVLIAAWCGGTALLRIVGVALDAVLGLPAPPYNSTALMAFDLITAVVAGWLAINSTNRAALRAVTAVLFGVLSVLTVCRLIVGVALVPRSQPLNPDVINAVFGNDLVHQITSTFDVTLVVLSLTLLAAVFAFDIWPGGQAARSAPAAVRPAAVPPPAAPKIARAATATPAGPPKIVRNRDPDDHPA